ncbi:hypothetical protein TRFO_42145 [Tritrichomonas foetus]|uniref:Uncharacterized protein n=1 Tax=Tritrichomonas foetus TaxID=1144522 RepID=A0A1J4L1Z2_9EUKA|nr:hypothetical protein TRFO_42145 [Tritrichomonas foetus]|eukprot:OHT15988.1 hypothetical protein TRFO_42145 [Tritrichomonas foetus]
MKQIHEMDDASSIENDFKIAQVLKYQNKTSQSINKFQSVIKSVENIFRQAPEKEIDLNIVPIAIGNLVEIYKGNDELDKALKLLEIQKLFLNKIISMKSNDSNKQDYIKTAEDHRKYTVIDLFDRLNNIFKMPSPKPPESPQKVLNQFLKEKEKQESDMAKENMMKLLEIIEAKKRRYENSRFERWSDWINNNPIAILIFSIAVFGTLLIVIVSMTQVSDQDSLHHRQLKKLSKMKSEVKDEDHIFIKKLTHENQYTKNFDPSKHMPHKFSDAAKMSQAEFEKFQKKIKELPRKVQTTKKSNADEL